LVIKLYQVLHDSLLYSSPHFDTKCLDDVGNDDDDDGLT